MACASPQKLVENNQYEKALHVATKRLKKGKAKWSNLTAFEKSFKALNAADSIHVQAMRSEGRPELWPEIYEKAVAILNRQRKVAPVVNRLHDTDFEPVVSFYPARALKEEAADKSALYFYAGAMEYLDRARNGNRQAARRTHGLLDRCRYYRSNYKDAPELQQEMYALGTTHILLSPLADAINPRFEHDMLSEVIGGKRFPYREGWQVIHLNKKSIEKPHYIAEMKLYDLYVSGNNCSSSCCRNSKEIEVGYEEVEVWNETDSVWVIEQYPIYEKVNVRVRTYTQAKSASLKMHFSIVDATSGIETNYKSFSACDSWANVYSEVCGDQRALDGSCSDEGGTKQSFPSDGYMLASSAADLSCVFYRALGRPVD